MHRILLPLLGVLVGGQMAWAKPGTVTRFSFSRAR
jgi:hypothetical protein